MTRQRTLGLAVGLLLLASLMAGPVFARAQSSNDLTQTYTWDAFGLAVRYPTDWTAAPSGDVISLHPAGRDVSDGQGPELVLFALPGTGPDQLAAAAQSYADSMDGFVSPVMGGTLNGHPTRSFTFDQTASGTTGGVTLVAIADDKAVGIAYIVRSAEAAAYLPLLQAMALGVSLDAAPADQDVSARAVQAYQDAAYGFQLEYPPDWVAKSGETPGQLTLRPADADPDAAAGPAFVTVILDVPDSDVDTVLDQVIGSRSGEFTTPTARAIGEHAARLVSYTTSTQGGTIYLIQIDARTYLAVGYYAPLADFDTYRPALEAIRQSIRFAPSGSAPAQAVLTGSSESVASVQLEQRFPWHEGSLVLYLPVTWEVATDQDIDGFYFTAAPRTDLPSGANEIRLIQGSTFETYPGFDPHALASDLAADYGRVEELVDVTVAGYSGVLYDVIDDSEQPLLHLRSLVLDLKDGQTGIFLIFGADVAEWDAFRPVVDAMIGSAERLDDDVTRYFSSSSHPIRADAYWIGPGTPVPTRQTGDTTKPYVWEDYGVTATLPSDWQGVTGGQDFDLAFVSPEASSSGDGAFITIQYVPTLGAGIDLEAALQSVAEQVGGEVEPSTLAGNDAAAIEFAEDGGTVHHLILVPYGDEGEMLYIQTTASGDEDEAVVSILDSLAFEPPVPDYDAVNAAWQQSLADSNRLIYGDPDAPVRLLEFLEMSCPHCANFSLDINRMMALEVETGRLRVETALMVFSGNEATSGLATQAIYCAAEQGKGYTAYKAIFGSYRSEGYAAAYTRDALAATLGTEGIGVDVEALNACLDAGTYEALIAETNTRATDYGVTGTPSALFATGEDDFQFLELPTGEAWSGGIPLEVLRLVVGEIIDEGANLSEMFSETLPSATDDATSMDASRDSAQDVAVSAALQATEEPDESVVEPAATERVDEEEQSEGEEASGTSMALVGGVVLLVVLVAVGFVMVSRRQAPPPPPPSRAHLADDDTLDVGNDDTL